MAPFAFILNRYPAIPGRVAQSVTYMAADPGVPAWSHTFVEIDHEIISTSFSSLSHLQEGLLSVTSESTSWLTA